MVLIPKCIIFVTPWHVVNLDFYPLFQISNLLPFVSEQKLNTYICTHMHGSSDEDNS